jgi:hypothetical protein
MKKITLNLFALLVFSTMFSQSYTTGTVTLDGSYNAKIDVNATTNIVTLTLNGPSDRYFALGFGVLDMINNGDCVIYVGAAGTGLNVLTDRTFNNNTSTPSLDSGSNTQSWNVTSNSVSGATRTIIATRPRVSTGDFTFPTTAGSLNLAWSYSANASYNLVYHSGNRAGITVNYTLSADSFNLEDFKIYPNPAKSFTIIELPANVNSGLVKIYDTLGRVVKNEEISSNQTEINISELKTGTYMVVIRTDYGNATKSLLIE